MSTTIRQVCDGWDATVVTETGSVTLHFGRQPTEAEVAGAVADYERAQAEAAAAALAASQPPETTIVVECEDGTYA